jgi:hypothetical protein
LGLAVAAAFFALRDHCPPNGGLITNADQGMPYSLAELAQSRELGAENLR